MGVGYPKVFVEPFAKRKATIGKYVIDSIRESWPGTQSDRANIVFRWGQDTSFPHDKTTVIFDCGYFLRECCEKGNRHFRLSINEYHPTRLPPADSGRWDKLKLEMHSYFDPNGHVLLVGCGKKARRKAGAVGPEWEIAAVEKIRKALPGRQIIYRPKKMRHETIQGTTADGKSTVEQLCKGCALVYTKHSNIGNEALRFGIPVVSESGPASDICPADIHLPLKPLPLQQRADFLNRLAYWQWSMDEIRRGDIWPWLINELDRRGLL